MTTSSVFLGSILRLTQEQGDTGHDDDESDHADSHAGAQHCSSLGLTISERVTQAHGDIDLSERPQNWAARVRHKQCDHILALLQLYQGTKNSVSA